MSARARGFAPIPGAMSRPLALSVSAARVEQLAAASIILVAVAYALVTLVGFPRWTVDDAYITFRYAENLARFGQLTWNIGEPPVEGYTGVLWPVLLALLMRMGLQPVPVSHIVGVVAYCAGAAALWLALRRLGVSPLVRAVTLGLFLTAPTLFTHALSGLETMLFVAAVATTLAAFADCLQPRVGLAFRESVLLVVLLFTSLVRPEGVALACTTLIALALFRARFQPRCLPGFLRRSLLLCIIPGGAYFVWRVLYYGQLLPNTFYVKSPDAEVNRSSLVALTDFLTGSFAGPIAVCGLVALILSRSTRLPKNPLGRRGSFVALAGGGFVVVASLEYVRSNLIMNYSDRFFVPFLPVLLIGIGASVDWLRRQRPARLRWVWCLALAGLIAELFINIRGLPAELQYAYQTQLQLRDEHVAAAEFIKQHVPASEWLAVHIDAGAIPYLTELRTVDFGGLNDPFLSHGAVSNAKAVDHFFAFRPGAAVFTSYDWATLSHGAQAAAIVADPRFADYVLAAKYQSVAHENYYQFVYLRRELLDGGSAAPAREALQ